MVHTVILNVQEAVFQFLMDLSKQYFTHIILMKNDGQTKKSHSNMLNAAVLCRVTTTILIWPLLYCC